MRHMDWMARVYSQRECASLLHYAEGHVMFASDSAGRLGKYVIGSVGSRFPLDLAILWMSIMLV